MSVSPHDIVKVQKVREPLWNRTHRRRKGRPPRTAPYITEYSRQTRRLGKHSRQAADIRCSSKRLSPFSTVSNNTQKGILS